MIEKKKILFVYNSFGIGGITKSLLTVLHSIDRSKYDITVYIRRNDVLELAEFIPDDIEFITVENEVKKVVFEHGLRGSMVKLLYNILRKRHRHIAKQLFISYKYPIQRMKEKETLDKEQRAWDTAICFSTDGDDPLFVSRCVNAKKKYVFVRQSTQISRRNLKEINRFDGVFVVNSLLIPWISQFVKEEIVFCLENYSDPNYIREKAEEYSVPSFEGIVIATCGRLCETKGYDYAVRSASLLKESGLNFIWYWIGDGPDRERMEEMIRDNKLDDSFIITGSLTNPYPYIKACDIYVQPSRAEAFGQTMVEALILKKPIICVRNYGSERIIEKFDAGVLTGLSEKEIADIVLEWVNNPSALHNEKEKVEAIDWQKEKDRYLSDWDKLLENRF